MTPLKKWMNAASAEDQELMAKRAGFTRNYLYQLAGGHRGITPDAAAAIELAAAGPDFMHLPPLTRAIAHTCAGCPYFKQCTLKKKGTQ